MALGRKTGGRKKGTPNKATAEARETFRLLVEGNAHRMQGWLERVGRKNPDRALQLMATLGEYVMPKLSRTELANDGSGKLVIEIVNCGGLDGQTHSG